MSAPSANLVIVLILLTLTGCDSATQPPVATERSTAEDEAIAAIEALGGQFTSREHLMIHNVEIADAGLEHLRALTNLKGLRLGVTQITDAGLAKLKGLRSLESLYLGGTEITDAGLANLKGHTSLQVLKLSAGAHQPSGAQALRCSNHKYGGATFCSPYEPGRTLAFRNTNQRGWF